MDRETLEKLASLGYVGAGAEPAADGSAGAAVGSEGHDRGLQPAAPGQQRGARAAVRRGASDPPRGAWRRTRGTRSRSSCWAARTWAWASTARRSRSTGATSSSCRPAPTRISGCRSATSVSATRPNALREAEAALAIDPRFTRRAHPEGRDPRGAGRLHGRAAGAARGRRGGPGEADDPARPREGAGGSRAGTGGAGRSTRRCWRLQPDFAPALTGLGALYAQQGRVRAGRGGAAARAGNRAARRAGAVQPGEGVRAARARPRTPGRSTRRCWRRQRDAGDARGRAPGAPGTEGADLAVRPSPMPRERGLAQPPSIRCLLSAVCCQLALELEPHAELRLELAVRHDLRRRPEVGRAVSCPARTWC